MKTEESSIRIPTLCDCERFLVNPVPDLSAQGRWLQVGSFRPPKTLGCKAHLSGVDFEAMC